MNYLWLLAIDPSQICDQLRQCICNSLDDQVSKFTFEDGWYHKIEKDLQNMLTFIVNTLFASFIILFKCLLLDYSEKAWFIVWSGQKWYNPQLICEPKIQWKMDHHSNILDAIFRVFHDILKTLWRVKYKLLIEAK